MNIKEYLKKSNDIESVFYKTNNFIRVCEFNVQYKHDILDIEQIKQLKKIDADIMCLVECRQDITEHFEKYIEICSNKSHCGFMKLFIHKRICNNKKPIIEIEKHKQYILSIIDTIFGKIIIGVLHFVPEKDNNSKREIALCSINDYCNKHKYPCIIGGDTNMRDLEKYETDFEDAWQKCAKEKYYLTWPNRNYDDKYSNLKPQKVNNDFRFDRFFLKKCISARFATINTGNSDHLMIVVDIKNPKNEYVHKKTINKELPIKILDLEPMKVKEISWLCEGDKIHSKKSGKWILYCKNKDMNNTWNNIKEKFRNGKLEGVYWMECSTAKKNPHLLDADEGVIYLYCDNSDNEKYIIDIGEKIINKINDTNKEYIYFKTNEQSINNWTYKLKNNYYIDHAKILFPYKSIINKDHIDCKHCGGIFDIIITYGEKTKTENTYKLNCLFCNKKIDDIHCEYIVSLEFIEKPKNHNTYWTLEDEYKLCNKIITGTTLEKLMKIFNRTETAIRRKIETMADPLLDMYRRVPKIKNNKINKEKIDGESSVIINISSCDINKIMEESHKDKEFVINVINRIIDIRKEKLANLNSEIGIKWLSEIMKKEKINIQHAKNGGEYIVQNTKYKADGYCKETNTIYEFYGCLYHGCKKCYNQDSKNPIKNKLNKDIYKKTIDRENHLKKHGYNIISIWEHDYKK